jgi:hypothetical protein
MHQQSFLYIETYPSFGELLAILCVRQVLFAPHDMPHRLSLGVLAIPFDIVNIVKYRVIS